jgi:hypothetical protein
MHPATLNLEAPYGFHDESGLPIALSERVKIAMKRELILEK